MRAPSKPKRPGFRTKSGAVKLQVLLHPAEYQGLLRHAKQKPRRSVSSVAREIIAFHLAYPGGPLEQKGMYQPRGFARA